MRKEYLSSERRAKSVIVRWVLVLRKQEVVLLLLNRSTVGTTTYLAGKGAYGMLTSVSLLVIIF